MFFSHFQSVMQQKMHNVTAFLPSCMQFIWWNGGQRGTVLEWVTEVEHTRGSGPQYASTCPHTGIVGRQSVLSRLVTSFPKTAVHIL